MQLKLDLIGMIMVVVLVTIVPTPQHVYKYEITKLILTFVVIVIFYVLSINYMLKKTYTNHLKRMISICFFTLFYIAIVCITLLLAIFIDTAINGLPSTVFSYSLYSD